MQVSRTGICLYLPWTCIRCSVGQLSQSWGALPSLNNTRSNNICMCTYIEIYIIKGFTGHAGHIKGGNMCCKY